MTVLLEPSRALEYLAYLGFTYQSGRFIDASFEDGGARTGRGAFFGLLSNNSGVAAAEGAPFSSGEDGSQPCYSAPSLSPSPSSEAEVLLRGLTVTNERRLDYIRRQTNRTVFYCRVYGARKVGKVSCACNQL